jgi:uncharacterized BrkB/YihY/UPF0761 family membrane protein
MQKSLEEHITFIENILRKKKNNFNWKALSDFNQTRIGFFQHERLIHLLITLFFGLMFFSSVIAALLLTNAGNDSLFLNFGLLSISAILLLLLFFYVWHYFFLENGVQKLYQLENQIAKHCQKNDFLK